MATEGPRKKTYPGSPYPSFFVIALKLTNPTLSPNIYTPNISILSTVTSF